MARGPLGGPRPLLSLECFLTVRAYTAVPAPTISGNTTSDRTDEFRETAQSYMPVKSFEREKNTVQENLGDILVATLKTDRLQLDEWISFLEAYADRVGTSDPRKLSVGIDSIVRQQNRLPRPFAETDVVAVKLLEIRMSGTTRTDLSDTSEQLQSDLPWIIDSTVSDEAILLQHQSGMSDFVSEQALQLRDELGEYGIPISDVTITCSTIEQ